MDYRRLGKTGLKVSELCMGTMQFGWTADEATSYQVLDAAWEAGINFFDTADVYTRWIEGNPGGVSETILGKWMKDRKIPRDQLVIATKVRGSMGDGPNDIGLSRYHIMHSIEGSLRRMQLDHVDLYQTHSVDDQTPIEETLQALDDLVRQGKVRYVGCSNYPAWRLMQALWTSDTLGLARYDSLQPHYNLILRREFEAELADVCRTYGIGVIPYSPLAAGFLSGKYSRENRDAGSARQFRTEKYMTEKNFQILDAIEAAAKAHNASISQAALAWVMANPVITSPIIGPRNMEQFTDNIGAVGLSLTPEELEALKKVSDWHSA